MAFVMRQSQLLISVTMQEVEGTERDMFGKKAVIAQEDGMCVAWEEKLSTWPCPYLGTDIILRSVRRFMI